MEELAGEKSGLVGLSALSEDEEQSLELFESVEQEEPVRRGWLKCEGQRNYFDLGMSIQGIHYLLRYIVRKFNPAVKRIVLVSLRELFGLFSIIDSNFFPVLILKSAGSQESSETPVFCENILHQENPLMV